MNKAESTQYLNSSGEDAPSSWMSMDIKSRIAELIRVMGKNPLKEFLGVTSAAKKDEIRAVCVAEGADITENMTKCQLMRKLREH